MHKAIDRSCPFTVKLIVHNMITTLVWRNHRYNFLVSVKLKVHQLVGSTSSQTLDDNLISIHPPTL